MSSPSLIFVRACLFYMVRTDPVYCFHGSKREVLIRIAVLMMVSLPIFLCSLAFLCK